MIGKPTTRDTGITDFGRRQRIQAGRAVSAACSAFFLPEARSFLLCIGPGGPLISSPEFVSEIQRVS